MMHLNVLSQCSPSPQLKGLWRHPADRSATGYHTLDHWITMGRRLEAACIDALFFADIHGVYDVYRGSWETALRYAVQVPSIDPVLVLPAIAANTSQLGLAVTYSTTYHPPYECARLFSSLDHLTNGRVGWNIVTSYLASANANGLGEQLPHDERYDRADEYLAVVLGLWEDSWRDDAVVRDAAGDVFVDPSRVREIGHRGRWFSVRGPHQCEPSLQRTPVLYQAGASRRGTEFAGKYAEVVFLTLPDPVTGAKHVAELRRHALDHRGSPGAVKALQAAFILVGRTRREAQEKAEAMTALSSSDGELAKWCGWVGFDLSSYATDTPLRDIKTEASRSVMDFLYRFDRERDWTIGDLRAIVLLSRRPHRRMGWLSGTPERIADWMEEWMTVGGVDGFNLIPAPPTAGIDDICDLLVPELQARGLFRKTYAPDEQTLRQRYFGADNVRYVRPR